MDTVTSGIGSAELRLAAGSLAKTFQMHWLALFDHSNCTVY